MVLAVFGGGLRAGEPATTLTLEQALASVENVNLNVLLGREAATQALEQARVTRATILPSITATGVQRRSKSVPLTNTGTTSPRPTNRFDALLNGSVPLMDFQRWTAARSARVGADVARADYNATLQTVLATVAQSYFTHLRNLRRMEVLDANITRAQSLLDLARNQLNAGVATQIDVTRAEAQLAQAQQAKLQQETVDVQSELTLKRAIDIDPMQPLRLADFTIRRADTALFAFSGDKTVFEKRADYLRAQKAVQQARLDVHAATFERLPSLTLGGNYGRGASNFDDELQPQWSANASLTLPIFDGLKSGADRRIALSRQRSQEARLRSLELQISAELRLAAQDANSRNAQIGMADKNLQLARDQLRLAQQRYQQGVADNREVVEAQTQLAVAEDNLVDATYQYNLSRVELARARGDVRTVLQEKGP
jgi:outer membrane protein TolC